MSFIVDDAYRAGVGTPVLERLAARARQRGVRRFRADVLRALRDPGPGWLAGLRR